MGALVVALVCGPGLAYLLLGAPQVQPAGWLPGDGAEGRVRTARYGAGSVDPTLWFALAALFAVAFVLGTRLLAHLWDTGFATVVALMTGLVIASVLIVGRVWQRGVRLPVRSRERARQWIFSAGVVMLAVVAVGAAALFATTLTPQPEPRYTLLMSGADSVNTVEPGQPIRINLQLNSFGYSLDGSSSVAEVTVNGAVVGDFTVELSAPAAGTAGAQSRQNGVLTLVAPAEPGRYTAVIRLRPETIAGEELPDPDAITVPFVVGAKQ